jgi:cytochrome c-type biogenesis protein CcmH
MDRAPPPRPYPDKEFSHLMSKKRKGGEFSLALALFVLAVSGGIGYGYAWDTSGSIARAGQAQEAGMELAFAVYPTPTPDPNRVEEVSRELYCPLCTGVRLDNCDLPLCDQMREVIRQKLADGETEQEIKAYFVDQYGETVTGTPPKRGGMILVWILPFLALFAAGCGVYTMTRRRSGQPESAEFEPLAARPLPAEYVERVERDLKRLG